MSKLVYLSGPIAGLTYDGATSWREYVANCMPPGVYAISPMRGKEKLKSVGLLGEYSGIYDSTSIKTRDRWDVRRADAMFVHFPPATWTRFSTGTTIEIGWADAFHVPIILACERDASFQQWLDHPIVKSCIGWHVETLDEGIEVLTTLFREERRELSV